MIIAFFKELSITYTFTGSALEILSKGYLRKQKEFLFHHLQIYDPKNARYEVPLDTPKVTKAAPIQRYTVIVSNTGDAFNFAVRRKMLEPGLPIVL